MKIIKEISIKNYINNYYKEFSKYVLKHRAIPSLIDGFKPVQRKAFYALGDSSKFVKVASLSGRMIDIANYNHGDTSASAAISNMAQEFIGSNNIPFFDRDGSFGTQLIPQPSAPRYIYIKSNKIMKKIFMDSELHLDAYDLEDPEPRFYLPIIPMILVNGVAGIAVGYSTKIQPYNPIDLIDVIIKIIDNDTSDINIPIPFYKGYRGKIKYDINKNKFYMFGKYEKINTTTLKITEVPVCYDRSKYLSLLSKMIDRKIISKYKEKSKNSWDIEITIPRESKIWENPYKFLRLYSPLHENINVIDENENVKLFNSSLELIIYFTLFRLNEYKRKIKFKQKFYKDNIDITLKKISFIREMCEIDFKNMTRDEIKNHMLNKGFNENELVILFKITALKFNKEGVKEYQSDVKEYNLKLDYYMKRANEKEMYKKNLLDLREELMKKYPLFKSQEGFNKRNRK